jgi:hypothetical protein
LRRIPWEFIHAGEELGYLAASAPRILFSRTTPIAVKRKLSDVKLPLQMLVVLSEPPNLDLGCHQEEEELMKALRPYIQKDIVRFDVVWNPNQHEFQQRLQQNRYHIIHFGGIDPIVAGFDNEEGIVLIKDGKPHLVQIDEFCTMVRGQNAARLLVLNTCLAAETLAPALVRAGVPSVVAMQFTFTSVAGSMFPRFFYPALLASQTKFQVDMAVTVARTHYLVDQERFGKEQLDWINPVLTTSVIDGNFLNVS